MLGKLPCQIQDSARSAYSAREYATLNSIYIHSMPDSILDVSRVWKGTAICVQGWLI